MIPYLSSLYFRYLHYLKSFIILIEGYKTAIMVISMYRVISTLIFHLKFISGKKNNFPQDLMHETKISFMQFIDNPFLTLVDKYLNLLPETRKVIRMFFTSVMILIMSHETFANFLINIPYKNDSLLQFSPHFNFLFLSELHRIINSKICSFFLFIYILRGSLMRIHNSGFFKSSIIILTRCQGQLPC